MNKDEGLYVVCYDIPADKLRTKIAERLEDFGSRIQYSVFECWLTPFGRDTMVAALKLLLGDEDGTIVIYSLGRDYRQRREALGEQVDTRPPDVYIF